MRCVYYNVKPERRKEKEKEKEKSETYLRIPTYLRKEDDSVVPLLFTYYCFQSCGGDEGDRKSVV